MPKLEYPVLKCPKDLGQDQVFEINKKIREIEKKFSGNIYLDMSEVEYMDSSALGALIHLWKTLDNNKVSIVIYKPSQNALKSLKECNLHRVFKIEQTPFDDNNDKHDN